MTLWTIFNNEENIMIEEIYDTEEEALEVCRTIEIEWGYGDPDAWFTKFSAIQYSRA